MQDEILWDFETAGHTAFIASFYTDDDVSVPDPPTVAQEQMMVLQDASGAHCVIVLPDDQKWNLGTVNTLGQLVKRGLSNGRRTLWDLSTLASGVYVITATNPAGKILTKKILRP